jgi:pectate lyase
MRVNLLRNTISLFFAYFLIYFQIAVVYSQQLEVADGWASVDSLGQNGTTGGEGGDVVTVTTTAEFMSLIITPQPVIIQVADTIILGSMVKVQSNKTIVGIGDQGVIRGGGLNLDRVSNIIIRNLLFTNSMDDAINVQEGTHHIWIDHCDLTDAYDGLIDIKRGSDFVTVSWNRFYNHTKTCLLGHSDNNAAQDVGHLRVTYHHNWFDRTNSRHPRVRFSALTHVYNNYYLDNSYGVGSTMDAEVLVEYNYFESVKDPTLVGVAASGPGDLVERNNIYDNCPNPPQIRGEVPEPPYVYEPDSAASIPALVMAGAGRVGFTSPVAFQANNNLPSAFRLMQNYPNPFNPTTTIQFQLPKASHVTLTIFNAHGQQVTTLLDSEMSSGMHNISFDAASLASGLYFYKIQAEGFSNILKMMLLK